MDRNQVIATLRAHEADLHRAGVARLYLFGSVSRGEARPDSDVDLFFDTDNPRFSLIELADVQEQVNGILGAETDVMTRASLHPMLRPQVEAEAIRVFWRAAQRPSSAGRYSRRDQRHSGRDGRCLFRPLRRELGDATRRRTRAGNHFRGQ